ncbi:aldehyde dehydrogenase family 3 member F1 [Cinnamomum micranthum f. kanehirae]|uniref:Aldehyde dehydrogenase n=1 Tax=Cinnamomum micranthum f. kanehirae TaxID=337451 RepID=A0A3S3N6K2_9MAGN|nr:aldehyde dehydrogenase family 3 member F1 [Cinnamomum micranthum f. kanehirae]
MKPEQEKLAGMEESLEELRETFQSGKTRSAAWRRTQLRALDKFLHEKEEEIFKVLNQDLAKHPVEVYRDELGILVKSVNLALDSLDKWMASKKVQIPLVAFPTKGELVPEPLGVVLIFSSWNFPLGLALDPLIGAISAGNAVVLKPSEMAPACASLLAKYLPIYLDNKAVKVFEGGPMVGQQLLEQRWDKIFFTGSARVGRIVMGAAANHLTPVTLELGGKCPAVVDSITSLEDQEINLLKKTIKNFYGQNLKESGNIPKIVNRNQFMRLSNLLKDQMVKDSIIHGGSLDEDKLFIEPTILLDPPLDAEIMNEEIFGPLLPIITLNNIQESIEFIKARPKPLAIYVFTNDETLKRRVIAETSSGSVTFNDAIIQFACDTLPFGGVGQSGFGRYHGKFSFDTFSHEKAIMRRNFSDFHFRYPPWNNLKMQFIRAVYHFNYFELILLVLGLKRS